MSEAMKDTVNELVLRAYNKEEEYLIQRRVLETAGGNNITAVIVVVVGEASELFVDQLRQLPGFSITPLATPDSAGD